MAQAGISANRLELSADRRRGGAREVDRPQDRHRGDGGRDPEGREIALRRPRTTSAARSTRRPARPSSPACWQVVESVENDFDPGHARRRAGAATPRPRSATSSPSRCRPSISAAWPPRTPSRSSCRRCARPSASASYSEYKDRIGEIVNGTVKRVEYGNVIVDLGRAEGIIRRDEMIPRENVRSATASAPTSTTCAASSAVRRSSSPAPGPSSCRSCSPRRCRRSTTASSRSSRWRAIRAPAPRSP